MSIEWQDSLSIGVMEIDIQHKLLFEKANAFLDACSTGADIDEINRLFWFLEAYALTHFREEERLMQDLIYPEFLKHRERHVEFMQDVTELKERLRVEGATVALVTSAKLFISEWLYEHISRTDRLLGEHVTAARR